MPDVTKGPLLLRRALEQQKPKPWSMGELERALSRHLGRQVGDGLVSKWVSGERTPGLEYALALEALLKVPAKSWVSDAKSSAA